MTANALPLAATGALFTRSRSAEVLGAVLLVSLLAFEAIAVAAAMPAIAGALDGVSLYALAFGGTLATSVLGMVLAGRSCDRHGAWRATVTGLALFSAGLLIAGLAPRMGWVVAGRIVQGLGGGMLGVALYVGMGQAVPAALHPRLFALFAAAWVLPALIGPAVAAALVQAWGWRAVFLAVAALMPLAALALLPAFARLPVHAGRGDAGHSPRRVAWAALAAAGALLLHGASQSEAMPVAMALLAIGLSIAWLAAHRLLPRGSLLVASGLPAVIALRGLVAAAFATGEVFIPLYLTREQGWSLAHAAMALSAAALTWSAGSALQARLREDSHRRQGLCLGFVLLAAGITIVGWQVVLAAPTWMVVAGWTVAGLGIGLAFPMLSVLVLRLSAPAEQGRNASALQLADALCSSAALALAGALFALGGGTFAYATVLLLALTLSLLGALYARRAFG
ncbi:MFS transporter [Variovorax sp. YR752]|uniref:MFS transporter n=1 Tax=Variovorax sp. YR752 TaxID=1884383 RepID=UPI003137D269